MSSQELLTNPGVEIPTSPSGWTLDEFATDPTVTELVNSALSVGFANQEVDGTSGIWLRPFVGAQVGSDMEFVNAVLSQSVPAVAGESYTFSGYSQFEQNYSGGVAFLDVLSPLGPIESPTQTLFELAFLDAGGSVLGSPSVVDLRNEQFNGFGWAQHTVNGVAPSGTATARVTASALDMAPNVNPGQSAFIDTFSLTTASASGSELLENNNLEIAADRPDGWVIEVGEEEGTARYEGFASRTGANGFWIAPRSADPEPLDARFTQTVAGTAGAEYTFSGWSFWEDEYSGGVETLNASTIWGAIPSDTETSYFIEFLDESGLVIETAELDLRTVQSNDRTWREHGVSSVAPEGTVEVKVGVLAESLRTNRIGDPFDDAYFDDFSLTVAAASLPGDYNGDGTVDAIDYTVWRDGGSSDSSQAGYDTWAANYGATSPSASQAIPEPTAIALVATLLAVGYANRRMLGFA